MVKDGSKTTEFKMSKWALVISIVTTIGAAVAEVAQTLLGQQVAPPGSFLATALGFIVTVKSFVANYTNKRTLAKIEDGKSASVATAAQAVANPK